jgi:predicted metal-binding protein
MQKVKVGILTCSNTTQILDCPVSACIKDLNERKGAFAEYTSNDVELIGVISCNGCPTVVGVEKILPKVETLVHYGVTHVHISYCMNVLCPFVKKYMKAIEKRFPGISLVIGTHEPHQTDDQFRCDIEQMLKDRHKTIIP